jgi:chemotaxis protein histidine kinase CheA
MLKVEEVKNNDSLWESLLRVADVLNGTNQAEAAIAVNKKERAQEAVDQIKEQQEALKDLQNQLKVLDIEEEKSAQKKSEDSKKAYQERKAQREQEAADNEAAWARELELMAEQKEAADQDEADRAEREEASQRRRMKLYLDDRNEKLKRQKEKDDAEKASAEKAKKLDEMRYSLAIDSAKQTLEAISSLMKNNAKAQKAISASLTLIDTYVAAQKAYASQMSVPSLDAPIRAAIAAGVAVASGLARVAAILRVDTSGGSVTATASGGGGGGSLDFSTQPNVGTSTQPSTLLNEQGQVINQNNDMRPMYVSVQEINDTNTNVRTAEERSRY